MTKTSVTTPEQKSDHAEIIYLSLSKLLTHYNRETHDKNYCLSNFCFCVLTVISIFLLFLLKCYQVIKNYVISKKLYCIRPLE